MYSSCVSFTGGSFCAWPENVFRRRYDGHGTIGFSAELLMCGRFRQTRSQKRLEERFKAKGEVEIVPRFNIAPTQPVVTVRQERGRASRRLSIMRWGLIPSWAKDMRNANQTVNARADIRAFGTRVAPAWSVSDPHWLLMFGGDQRLPSRSRTPCWLAQR